MNEDDTFNALRRRPVGEVWLDLLSLMSLVMRENGLCELRATGNKKIEKWIRDQGWRSYTELKKDYDRFLQSQNFKFD